MQRCIILNGDYSFLNTVSWKRAICLLIKEKAEVLKESDRIIRNGEGKVIFKVPLVLKLIKVIRMIYKNRVPFTKRNIMVRDKYKCMYCGSPNNLTIDHVIPISQGGKSSFNNCVACCRFCNCKKSGRTPSEAKMFLTRQPYSPTISEFLRLKMEKLKINDLLKEIL